MRRRLNILLYIETSGPGGAETVMLDIARKLDKDRFNPTVVLHRSRWLHEQLKANRVDTRIIPSRRSLDVPFLKKFVKLCRELKTDVIHSHLSGANLYACLAGAIGRIPVIATYHNELYMPTSSEKYVPLKTFIVRKLASMTILVADFMKKEYAERGKFPPNRLMTIYSGIDFGDDLDVNTAKLRQSLDISDDKLVVGNVANLRSPKGHQYLVEAAAQICKDIPNVEFLLIGEEGKGNLKEQLEDQIADLRLEENVKLLGFRRDVKQLLRIMDVFVLPSLSEGLPLSVVEAMAASLPVVATDVGGLKEIVSDGETGYLVESGNAAVLADKVSTLLTDKNLRKRMGNKGRKVALDRFSLESMIDNYQNLYEKLVS